MGSSAEWDRGASDWSGSDLCASRQLVAQRAQLLRGLADGVGLVAHMTALPLLGLLADAYGRQRICMLAAMGLTLQCALLYLASTAPTAAAVLPCVFAGEVVHGLRCALPLRPTPSLLSAVCQT
jgi:MFS family permease